MIVIVNEVNDNKPFPIRDSSDSYSQNQGVEPPIDMTLPDPLGEFTKEEDIKKYGLDQMYQNGVLLTVSQATRVMQKRHSHASGTADKLFDIINKP